MANTVANQLKQLWMPLYDSVRYATTGHTELALFSDAYGAGTSPHVGSGTKKLVDTNLRGKGAMLPGGERMSVQGIRVKYKPITKGQPTEPNDIALLQQTGVLTLKIGGATFVEQQLIDFNSGCGVSGFAITTASTTTIEAANAGVAIADNFWKFYGNPIELDDSLSIECTLTWPVAVTITTSTVITVQLEGVRTAKIVA